MSLATSNVLKGPQLFSALPPSPSTHSVLRSTCIPYELGQSELLLWGGYYVFQSFLSLLLYRHAHFFHSSLLYFNTHLGSQILF